MSIHAATLVFVQLLSFFFPLLSFSLKNCTLSYSKDISIVSVSCNGRILENIPDEIPHDSTYLDLGFNKISVIKATDLTHLSKLNFLVINNNRISHIEDKSFANLKELKSLRIFRNKLTNLTDNMFVGLENLVFVNLMYCQISYISSKAFQPLVSLKTALLDFNHIHHIQDIVQIFQLPNIAKISFMFNNIRSLDSDELLLNTTTVTAINLAYNSLSKFSLKRDIFPHLQSLDLKKFSHNFTWYVANKTFLRSVTELHLDSMFNLNTYTAILNSTISLKTVHLSGTHQHFIKDACSIPSLTTFNFIDSPTKTVDDHVFWPCSRLTWLSVSGHSLNKLPDQSLQSLTQIRVLDLHENEFSKVPRAVQGLSTLKSLDLSSNLISDLDCLDFANLTKLTTLNLYNNRITKLPECVFQNLCNLRSLYIKKKILLLFL